MKRLAGAFVVMALALTGCGGSLCEDTADSLETLSKKAKPCGIAPSTPPTENEIKQCEDNLDKCTDADKKALGNFNDCIDKLATCSTDTQNTFGVAVLACAAYLENVSENCGTASTGTAARIIANYSVSR
jgi:hypothetical protein